MTQVSRATLRRSIAAVALVLAAAVQAACGGGAHSDSTAATSTTSTTSTSTTTSAASGTLPGTGKPPVTIGDKNFTEQFVLGELYAQALAARGYSVTVNRNIGPTEVTMQALYSGRLSMYPEYLGTWNSAVAGDTDTFDSLGAALHAGRRFAREHGLELLEPTPFSNTEAIAVTVAYGQENGLRSIADLRKVAGDMTIGAAPQLQQSATGLPAFEQGYGFYPAAFTPLDIGGQYQALDRGTVQAAAVSTTDAELVSGDYTLLRDPLRVSGWGEVVPVVPDKVLSAEGPTFAETVNQVSALLTAPVIRQLNAAVDIAHQDPATLAKQFLADHGVIPAGTAS